LSLSFFLVISSLFLTLFIGNIPNSINDDDIHQIFGHCGPIQQIRWLKDKNTGRFKGCGFIDFYSEESAVEGAKLNGSLIRGDVMRVDFATKPKDTGSERGSSRSSRSSQKSSSKSYQQSSQVSPSQSLYSPSNPSQAQTPTQQSPLSPPQTESPSTENNPSLSSNSTFFGGNVQGLNLFSELTSNPNLSMALNSLINQLGQNKVNNTGINPNNPNLGKGLPNFGSF